MYIIPCHIGWLELLLNTFGAVFVQASASWTHPRSLRTDDLAVEIMCRWFPLPPSARPGAFQNLSEELSQEWDGKNRIMHVAKGWITNITTAFPCPVLKSVDNKSITTYPSVRKHRTRSNKKRCALECRLKCAVIHWCNQTIKVWTKSAFSERFLLENFHGIL